MKQSGSKIKKSGSTVMFDVLGYTLVSALAVICLLPFIMIVTGSISDEDLINRMGFSVFPRGFSLDAYRTLFLDPLTVLNAYKITILVTAVGTVFALFVVTMTAFVLSRPDFKYRNAFSFFFFFTTLFSGGIVSSYIFMVKYYHL